MEYPTNVCLPQWWLVVSVYPKGSATGHLDTSSLDFLLSSSKCRDGFQVQVATACFSCSPPELS
jgi:hypothetical protein